MLIPRIGGPGGSGSYGPALPAPPRPQGFVGIVQRQGQQLAQQRTGGRLPYHGRDPSPGPTSVYDDLRSLLAPAVASLPPPVVAQPAPVQAAAPAVIRQR